MTKGTDDSGIRCPYCGKTNRYVTATELHPGEIREFVEPCAHCKRPVYYWARLGITLEAEQEGKTV